MTEGLVARVKGASGFDLGKTTHVYIEAGGAKYTTASTATAAWDEAFDIPPLAAEIKFMLFKDKDSVGALSFKTENLMQKVVRKKTKKAEPVKKRRGSFKGSVPHHILGGTPDNSSDKSSEKSSTEKTISSDKSPQEKTSTPTQEKPVEKRNSSKKYGRKHSGGNSHIHSVNHHNNIDKEKKDNKELVKELKDQLSWSIEERNEKKLEFENLQQELNSQKEKNKQLEEKLRQSSAENRNPDNRRKIDADKVRRLRNSEGNLSADSANKDAIIKVLKLKIEKLEEQQQQQSKEEGGGGVEDLKKQLVEANSKVADLIKLVKESEDLKIMYAEAKTKLHQYKEKIKELDTKNNNNTNSTNNNTSNTNNNGNSSNNNSFSEGNSAIAAVYKLQVEALKARTAEIEGMLKEATTKYFELFDLYEELKKSSENGTTISGNSSGNLGNSAEISKLKKDLELARVEIQKWKDEWISSEKNAKKFLDEKNNVEKKLLLVQSQNNNNNNNLQQQQQQSSLKLSDKEKLVYEEKIKKLEQEKKDLEEKLKQQEKDKLTAITTATTTANEKIKLLENQNNDKLKLLEKDKKELEDKVKIIEKEKATTTATTTAMTTAMTTANERIKTLENQNKQLDEKIKTIEKEKTAMTTANTNNNDDKNKITEKLKESEEKLKIMEREKITLNEKLRNNEKSEKMTKELSEEKSKLAALLKSAEDRIKSLEKTVSDKDTEISKAKESQRTNLGVSNDTLRPSTSMLSLPSVSSVTPSVDLGIPPDLPIEKELELLRDRLKKADGDIKKAVMQGRILQKKAEEKSREDLRKAQKESESNYEQLLNKMTGDLEIEKKKLEDYLGKSEKERTDKKLFETRYMAAETVLKDQNKVLQDILGKVKSAQTGNTKLILQEILASNIPQFSTHIEMNRPNELLVKYGVPLYKMKM